MKILVMSDSHGAKSALLKAATVESPELILHLGDHDRDCVALTSGFPEIPLRSVKGNCDGFSSGLVTDEFVLSGKRFFMTHGHAYRVKYGLNLIIEKAQAREADILLFGHTHIPHYSLNDNLVIINPGSISTGQKTYAVLNLSDDGVSCEIRNITE